MADDMIEHDVRQLGAALDRLGAALDEPASSTRCTEDTSQAFVYAMSLFWKVVKALLVRRGVEVHMPREAVRFAFEKGWLNNPDEWIQLLKDEYELSGGTSSNAIARTICQRIRSSFPEMRRAHALMVARLMNPDDSAVEEPDRGGPA